MKLRHYEPKHVPDVHRVIDLTGPIPEERVVINLTDAAFHVGKPYWEDGPPRRIPLPPRTARGRHAKRGLFSIQRKRR
jgi:hypothetical protein